MGSTLAAHSRPDSSSRVLEDSSLHQSARPPLSRWQQAHRLIAICLLSVGAHFGGYIFGPLTGRLGDDRSFSGLIAAAELLGTVAPLLAGLVIPRLGLGRSALLVTSLISLGLFIAALAERASWLGMQMMGWLIFSSGVSPIAVVQESMLVDYAANRSILVAIGLLTGKMSSLLATVVTLPLADTFGTNAPFQLAALLGLLSLAAGAFCWQKEDLQITPVRASVTLLDVVSFESAFWLYLLVCCLSGAIWFPFIHLSPSFAIRLFDATPFEAIIAPTLILLLPLILYPLIGQLLRKGRSAYLSISFGLASTLTSVSLVGYLFAPAHKSHLVPAILGVPFAIGRGYAPMLLVLFVPEIVGSIHTSTALGMHKAIEQGGASLSQTIVGEILEGYDKVAGVRLAVGVLLTANFGQLAGAITLGTSLKKKKRRSTHEELQPLLEHSETRPTRFAYLWLSLALMVLLASWAVFLWARLLS